MWKLFPSFFILFSFNLSWINPYKFKNYNKERASEKKVIQHPKETNQLRNRTNISNWTCSLSSLRPTDLFLSILHFTAFFSLLFPLLHLIILFPLLTLLMTLSASSLPPLSFAFDPHVIVRLWRMIRVDTVNAKSGITFPVENVSVQDSHQLKFVSDKGTSWRLYCFFASSVLIEIFAANLNKVISTNRLYVQKVR